MFEPKPARWVGGRHRARKTGGADRDRTDYLRSAIAALSQMSYGPVVSRHLRPGLPQCQENARRSGTWLPIPDFLRGRTEIAGPEVRFSANPLQRSAKPEGAACR